MHNRVLRIEMKRISIECHQKRFCCWSNSKTLPPPLFFLSSIQYTRAAIDILSMYHRVGKRVDAVSMDSAQGALMYDKPFHLSERANDKHPQGRVLSRDKRYKFSNNCLQKAGHSLDLS